MFECEASLCKGGKGNLDGIAECQPTNTGRQCTDCLPKPSMFKFNGACYPCPALLGPWSLLLVFCLWLAWYFLNSVICENIETADQFFKFVQIGAVIGGFSLSWPHTMEHLFKLFDSLDFDVVSSLLAHCPEKDLWWARLLGPPKM